MAFPADNPFFELPLPLEMGEIARLRQGIADALRGHDPLAVAGYLLAAASFVDERFESSDVDAFAVEYILAANQVAVSPAPPLDPVACADAIAVAVALAGEVHAQTVHALYKTWQSPESALHRLAVSAELDDAFHRFPGYLPQGRDLVRQCFDLPEPASAALRARVGFDGAQAVALEQAFMVLLDRSLDPILDQLPTTADGRTDLSRRHAEAFLAMDAPARIAISPDALAHAAEMDLATVRAFLDRFSLPMGVSAPGRPLVSGRNGVRERPLIQTPDGRYLPTIAGNLHWALRPTLEAEMRGTSLWEPYQRRRAAHLEHRAAALLAEALGPAADVAANVAFSVGDDPSQWEADLLVRIDDVCFVVEVKAGELSAGARRGRLRELRQDLQRLLGKSTTQVARLTSALRDGSEVRFLDRATREPLDWKLATNARIAPIIVTLEDLTVVAADGRILREAGILDPDTEPPWVVNVFDLEMIVRSTAFPAQLTRYVFERARLDPRAYFNDESELWLAYLAHGFDFSRIEQPTVVLTGRKPFLHAQWTAGASAPTMPIRASDARRLRRLERERPEGWLREAEVLVAKTQSKHRLGRVPRIYAGGGPAR